MEQSVLEENQTVQPAEVKILKLGNLNRNTAESSVRHVVIEKTNQLDGISKFYKLPYKGGSETSEVSLGQRWNQEPLTKEQALQVAQQFKTQYENAVLCFGYEHVAKTDIVVGQDTTYPHPQVHIYQEVLESDLYHLFDIPKSFPTSDVKIEDLRDFHIARAERMEEIKLKTFDELDTNDPVENDVRRGLETHREALQKLYISCVESTLLGYTPDLQYWYEDFEHGNVGYIFSQNFGITTDEQGIEHVKYFDFGEPRYDFLITSSRSKLRQLIDAKKAEGELAIIKDKHDYPEYQLAPWYREALKVELENSIDQVRKNKEVLYVTHGLGDIDLVVKEVLSTIEENATGGMEGKNIRYGISDFARELRSLCRLSKANEYYIDKTTEIEW